jgi:hypothetical protein
MARAIALAALVTLVSTTGLARASDEEGMGAVVDLTGVDGSSQVDESADAVPDLTVEDRRAQQPERPYGIWDRLAACESTSRWHIATGNGYFGGLQQDMTFWRRHGGMSFAPRPDLASREQQIAVAERGLAVQGWAAWPNCSRRLGLR